MDEVEMMECDSCGEITPASDWGPPDWPDNIPQFNPEDFICCPACNMSRYVG